MNKYILSLKEIDKHNLQEVGGKGANLGELSKIDGITVPGGFCVTTAAYKKALGDNTKLTALIDELSNTKADDHVNIKKMSGEIRSIIEKQKIPTDIEDAIVDKLSKLGENEAYAVRSSATAEDLPTASFAGQQDTYLNIMGKEAIFNYISKCWASLFTDRAVIYRIQKGFDHRKVFLSVVVQKMVFPEASGIMFTADPITSNPKTVSIEASFGLGEALVSGLVNADSYTVKEGAIIDKKVAAKEMGIYASEAGGTQHQAIGAAQQTKQTLSDTQIVDLAVIGKKIEKHFDYPQDIEWGIVGSKFVILQSRPITTLYPVPQADGDQNRVYISGGHMQMMTDPIKPLGMFFFQIVVGDHPSKEIGGRLYMDITHDLASPISRILALFLMKTIGEDLMLNAVKSLVKRKELIKSLPRGKQKVFLPGKKDKPSMGFIPYYLRFYRQNDSDNVRKIIEKDQALIAKLQKDMDMLSGESIFDFIEDCLRKMKGVVVTSESTGVLTVGLLNMNWINKKLEKWLGIKNAADTLIQSVPNSVTSDTGNTLLDVSDTIRKYPKIVRYLRHDATDETLFEDLAQLDGGDVVAESIHAYLQKYGMRCSGDIDITRPRWRENPTALIPTLLSNIKNFPVNAREYVHQQGMKASKEAEKDILRRLSQLPGGKRKAKIVKKKISVVRNHVGFREYPKYAFVQRYAIYKEAMLREAEKLVAKGLMQVKEDIYYLYFDELRQAVTTQQLDYNLITKRKAEYAVYETLTAPRVITTMDGIVTGRYHNENLPDGALPGTPVSAGVVEGRARIILNMEDADVDEGDILVTVFTDPSWTPVFVSLKGLVTEVGGLVTHGAVIAREYGLPAVVSVENATKLIKDGDMIRVNGTEGYVEILSE